MICTQARPLLPALVYGDLSADEADALTRHLDDCPACRGEYAGLAQVRQALDAGPVPPVAVDVPRLFAESAARQERRARTWRRLAVAGAALAAGLLVALGLRLQVRIGDGQVVIAWGAGGASGGSHPPGASLPHRGDDSPRSPQFVQVPPSVEERLRVLQDLTHALAAEIDSRDRRRQQETDLLRTRLDSLQRVAAQRWAEAERLVSALYVAQFKRPQEKQIP